MHLFQDPQFGDKMITLMAALVLVLQIAMVAQRWIVTNIRLFAAQSFLLAAHRRLPSPTSITRRTSTSRPRSRLLVKVILVPLVLERLVERIEIRQEIEPIVNMPLSIVISGGLTLVGYVVAESFYRPEKRPRQPAWATTRWRWRSLFS